MSEKDERGYGTGVLDPEAQAVVEGMEGAFGAPLNELPIDQARERMTAMHALLPPGPEMHAVHDVAAPGPDGDVPLRIYVPSAEPGLPVLIWIHGGAWVFGELDYFDASCSDLAARAGAIVVSVGYRLAPEHPFPAGPEDSYAALLWVADHISEFGGDPGRIAVGGDSAGGNLTAAVTMMARDRSGPSIVYQLLIYPAMDDGEISNEEFVNEKVMPRASHGYFWDLYAPRPEDRENPYCVPINAADLSGLPPAFVVVPAADWMRDSQIRYAELLREAGVPTRLEVYEGMPHGFLLATASIKRADLALDEVAADMRAAFDPPAAQAS
ncbi:MAG: alpha/beta hydrolase [Solirubrobacterales bacterium]